MLVKHIFFILSFLVIISVSAFAKSNPGFLKYSNDQWVDSVLKKMTIDQKIGQLFMIQAYSNGKYQHPDEIIKLINTFHVGGIIFMQGSPTAQAELCNKLQKASDIPLLTAIDAETGLGFRLDSTLNYPVQMALGAITNDSLIYQMGYEIGTQCRMLGINMNMAPVSDINVNPENPVINYRSFGEDKTQVARKSWLYASGMQDARVLATAKHFPGHGDTQADSHYDLPTIKQTKNELDSLELFPFSYLIKNGIGAVMTGHLQVPALEPNTKIPATLSSKIITKKLKSDLGFDGLVITDAMNMKGISNLYSSAESTVKALKAGNDMIEIVPRLDRAFNAVKQAVANGTLTVKEIDEKCRKILTVKKWLRLDKNKLVETKNLHQKLNDNRFLLTKRILQEQSITVLANDKNLIPLQQLDTLKIASLMIGSVVPTAFQKMIGNYTKVDHFNIGKTPSEEEAATLINQLKPYNQLIVGIHEMGLYPKKRFGITDQQISLIEKLKDFNPVICFFGNPYAIPNFNSLLNARNLIVTYQDDKDIEELTAQLIFGATGTQAKLPVHVSNRFPINSGIVIAPIKRLKYTIPEEVKINSVFLKSQIDSLAAQGIQTQTFPGCQVLIAKEGKVIFHECYGNFTYEKIQPVQAESIYDLASITQLAASFPVIMSLYDQKKIDLDTPFSKYFKEFNRSHKAEITVRDVLTHQARLQSNLPLRTESEDLGKTRKGIFRSQPAEKHQVRISSGLYGRNDFKNQIIHDIIKTPLLPVKEYHYSDLGFSLLPIITERLTNQSFQEILNKEFFKPLGAATTCFKPYERFSIDQIAPTENDQTFRKELLQGFVQDELAALFGGISGHAGLFSSANDLAKVLQIYLQSGYYGGKQFISTETVRKFTTEIIHLPGNDRNSGDLVQCGNTGTFVSADPENQLLFIFLSNGIYPDHNKLNSNNLETPTKMYQAIGQALKREPNKH